MHNQRGAQHHSGNGHHGVAAGTVPTTVMIGGGQARRFTDGSYVEATDADAFSVAPGGALTLEAWIRPDTLDFPNEVDPTIPERRYVHWMGKGVPEHHEYAARMYSDDSIVPGSMLGDTGYRPNRVSGYAFKPDGKQGNGSYFQPGLDCPAPIHAGEWMHVVVVINTSDADPALPQGYTRIYRDGVLCDTDSLDDPPPGPGLIHPQNLDAPFRIGTQEGQSSFFHGAIGKVAVYGHELDGVRIGEHHREVAR